MPFRATSAAGFAGGAAASVQRAPCQIDSVAEEAL